MHICSRDLLYQSRHFVIYNTVKESSLYLLFFKCFKHVQIGQKHSNPCFCVHSNQDA